MLGSFQEFQDKLLQWSTATNRVWVKSNSKTVETANKKLSSKSKTFDQKFKFRNVLYRCKHGGAPRQLLEEDYGQIKGMFLLIYFYVL